MKKNHFDQYAEDIDAIKKPYANPLSGMLSYSSGVDNYAISIKFFPEASDLVHREDAEKAIDNMKYLQSKARELLAEVEADDTLTQGQKGFLENAIQTTIVNYDMLLDAVWIEAEKGGYSFDGDREELLVSIEEKETKLYGPRVSDVPEERDAVVRSFSDLYEKKGGLLSGEDQEVFGAFLRDQGVNVDPGLVEGKERNKRKFGSDKLWEIFSRVYEIYGEKPCRVHLIKDSHDAYKENGIHYMPASWTGKQKNDYYRKHHITDRAKICFNDVASNISVGYDANLDSHSITFPSDGSYSWQRICELIDHEIGTHYMRNENSGRGTAVRSAGYLETEEGIATTNEAAVTVLHLEDLTAGEPTIHHLSTFVAENYNYEQTMAIMKAYFVMIGKSEEDAVKEAKKRTDRVKRFHAYDKPGANRKDTVYRRGKRHTVDFLTHASLEELQEWRDLMYQGKFSEKDKGSIEGLLGKRHPDFKCPYALGKILYQRSLGVKMDELKEDDKRFQLKGEELNATQKRKVIEILNLTQ